MTTPQVSIIIPVYNKEKYLKNTIDSIKKQNFQDYEVIIVNDGSTDQSRSILCEYLEQDSRVTIIDIPNGGVSNARNIGLENSKGKWIQFLDGDDIIDKNYLSSALHNMHASDVDIIFSNFLMINKQGDTLKEINSGKSGVVTGSDLCDIYIENQKYNGFFGFISNKLFRRDLLEEIEYCFDSTINLAEDLDLYSRIYQRVNQALFINVYSFFYLQNEENYTNDESINYRSQLKIRLNIKKWFVSMNKYIEYKSEIDSTISQFVFFVVFHDNEQNLSLLNAYKDIVDNAYIMDSLTIQGLNRFEKSVIRAIMCRNYNKLCKIFKIRNSIRAFYRKVIKHGKICFV